MIDTSWSIALDWQGLASMILHLLLKMSGVLVVALLLDVALRRRFVVACSTMWNTTLCLLALMPIACLVMPAAKFAAEPLTPAPAVSASTKMSLSETTAPAVHEVVEQRIELPRVPAPAVTMVSTIADAPIAAPAPAVVTIPADTTVLSDITVPADITVPVVATLPIAAPTASIAAEPSFMARVSWPGVALALGIVYVVGLFVGLTKLLVAARSAQRLRLISQPIGDADWQRRLDGWRRQFGLARRVELRQSPEASVPLVLGGRRPAVIVPADVADSSELGFRDAILVHELAHVVRGDFSWQLLQRGLEAMLWFHPLVWLMGRRIGVARERVCDEFTVHHLGGPQTYVETLLAMASRLTRRCSVSLGLAVLRSSNLGERLAAMHDSSGNARCQPGRLVRLAAAAVAILLAGWFGRAAVADPAVPRVPGLTNDASDLLSAFEADSNRVRVEAERQIAAKRAELQTQLRALQTHYTRQDNLDAAVAIRDQILLLRAGAAARDSSIVILDNPSSMMGHKDAIGKSFYIRVQGGAGTVWGTDVYTHDSGLAAAAVHAGVLELGQQGVVKVTIARGPARFNGSVRHNVTSYDWDNTGGYYSAYRVERAPEEIAQLARAQATITATRTAVPVVKSYTGYTTVPGPAVQNVLPDPGMLLNYRGAIGQTFTFSVVGATGAPIWGTDVYTDDTALATAIVHAGMLQPGQHGIVRVTILPAQDRYEGSTRHGVTSSYWGYHGGSYSVQLIVPDVRVRVPGLDPVEYTSPVFEPPRSAPIYQMRSHVGQTVLVKIVGSTTGTVWGSDVYTDDSSIEAAAVHAGVLRAGEEGLVRVTILPGQGGYSPSTRNGVTTHAWGNWGGSFRLEKVDPNAVRHLNSTGPVEADPSAMLPPAVGTMTLDFNNRTTIRNVVGSNAGSLWGSDIYTSDSSVAMAAVHAGILRVGEEGLVQVTWLPGQSSYEGTTRNGVTSMPYGQWDGSFRVAKVGAGYSRSGPVLGPGGRVGSGVLNIETLNIDTGSPPSVHNVIGSTTGPLWGSDVYTNDSSIETAAVHAGILKEGEAGTVVITRLPGQNSYEGTSRNGVTSSSWGQWSGSFRISRPERGSLRRRSSDNGFKAEDTRGEDE